VVGAGITGAAIAFYLAKAGQEVLAIERAGVGGASSGANMGMVNVSMKRPSSYTKLSLESRRMYPGFLAELNRDVAFTQTGTVYLIEGRPEESSSVATHNEARQGENFSNIDERLREVQQVEGISLEQIDEQEVRQRLGFFPARFESAYFCPVDCWVNPFHLNTALIQTARDCGAQTVNQVEFLGLETGGGAVQAAQTSHGRVETRRVVLAAGVALPTLLKPLQSRFPLQPNRGHVLVTEPVTLNIAPTVVHIDCSGNFVILLQTDRGNLLIGATHEVGVDSTQVNLSVAEDLARRAVSVYPFLEDVNLIRIWAGVRPWPGDVLPIIGEFEHTRGLYAVTSHSGVTLAPILGRMASDLILDKNDAGKAKAYSLNRFAMENRS
jgi:sarcosine oxidase subunit beta